MVPITAHHTEDFPQVPIRSTPARALACASAVIRRRRPLKIPMSGAKAKFSSQTHREVDVDLSGKMNWQTGRGYEGEWEIYWSSLTP
jgi:hypothetical protein